MIAIFVLYIHHKIFLAQFENLGSVGSADFPGWQAFF